MNSKRLYFLLVASICLLVVGLTGGAYGASQILAGQSKSLIDARSKAAALEQQQTQLSNAKASVTKYQDVSQIARSIVPQDKDQAQAVREIVKIASDNGVKLGAITFPSSTLGGTGSTSGTTGASGTPAPKGPNPQLSQLIPAPGLSGVYTLKISVQSDSNSPTSYDKFVRFMAALENNRRTALVSAIALQPDAKNPSNVGFTLTIDEYIKP